VKKREPNREMNVFEAAAYLEYKNPGSLRNKCQKGIDHPAFTRDHRGRLVFMSHDLDAYKEAKRERREAELAG